MLTFDLYLIQSDNKLLQCLGVSPWEILLTNVGGRKDGGPAESMTDEKWLKKTGDAKDTAENKGTQTAASRNLQSNWEGDNK